MLQPTLIPIRGNRPVKRKAYIFVNKYMQRGDLIKLEYFNAEEIGNAHYKLFTELFEFAKEDVVICRDYSKNQVLSLLK